MLFCDLRHVKALAAARPPVAPKLPDATKGTGSAAPVRGGGAGPQASGGRLAVQLDDVLGKHLKSVA